MRRSLGRLRRRGESVVRAMRERRRHRAIAATPATRDRVAVSYGRGRVPSPDEPAHGGTVKLQHLQGLYPNEPTAFNLLYLVSSSRPPDSSALLRLARARGASVVANQDGVAYPGWHGPGWERTNEPLAELVHAADHVIFQSAFCKASSDRFLGERTESWEILLNPVDTRYFSPEGRRSGFTILLAGNQYQRYRFEVAVETLALVARERPDARLFVTGAISWDPDRRRARSELDEILSRAGLEDRVELAGTYTQREAPSLYRRAHVLLHPKYNDPCPTAVLEAMACGLPVVYSGSGGTPELVGTDAGVAVPAPLDWERDHPPDAQELARAVLEVSERLDELSVAARARAEQFDVRPWLERHRELFEGLVR
jgi:glycosyltransferase involved in cell wall biosynthesis